MSTGQPVRQIIRTRRRNTNADENGPANEVFELEDHLHGAAHELPSGTPREPTSIKTNQKSLRQRGLEGFKATCTFSFIRPEERLGYLSTSFMIINRVVGTGIFDIPPTLFTVVGSKGAAMMAWLFGCIITWAGLIVYIEYGVRFPLSGGELYYIDFVFTKPAALATYMYGIMFIVLGGCQGNALAFGSAVQIASLSTVNYALQKILAVTLVALVCLLQAYSRGSNFFISNVIGCYKVILLLFIAIAGWVALSGKRSLAAKEGFSGPFGMENLSNSFTGTSTSWYNWGVAFLLTQRAFLGFEYANQVLEEIKRPKGDEFVIFRHSAKFSIALICILYLMVNLAFCAACTLEEIKGTFDVTGLFFEKIFGPSVVHYQISATLKAIAAVGNVIAFSYSSVKVQQEIGRLGILPWPEFWARSSHGGTPGPALFLQFIFTSLIILGTPLGNINGYTVISTLFAWTRSWVGVLLGVGLLFAWKLKAFQRGDEPWKPQSMPKFNQKVSWVLVIVLCILYTLANLSILVLGWIPANFREFGLTRPVVPSYMGPAVGTLISCIGAVYWAWNRYILPALGYRMSIEAERGDGFNVQLTYTRYISGFSIKVLEAIEMTFAAFHSLRNRLTLQKKDFSVNEPSYAYHTLGSSRGQRIGWG